jgi:UDP-galactopyranose mutase
MPKYDYLIVGSGLFGCVFAHEVTKHGKSCLILDKRSHIGGNVYNENIEGINVHTYGPHIFHTNDKETWDFVNSFVPFNRFTNSPLANYNGEIYNLPFNMNTFKQLWGVNTPSEAKEKLAEQMVPLTKESLNLENHVLASVGKDIYEKLIKGYTEKQWGRPCNKLPASIIKRIPIRFTFNNNYYNDTYQGVPIGGYNKLIDGLLEGIETRTETDYFLEKDMWDKSAHHVVYSGKIDEYFGYQFGKLDYRSMTWKHRVIETDNYQGNAIVNFTDSKTPFTRIIEHKHFEFGTQPKTVVSEEYPQESGDGDEPHYPINDDKNLATYAKYKMLADQQSNVIFGGRLAQYKYYDMHQVIAAARVQAQKAMA